VANGVAWSPLASRDQGSRAQYVRELLVPPPLCPSPAGGGNRALISVQDGRGGGVRGGAASLHPPCIPLFPPAAAMRPGATPTALPPRAGTNRLVEGLRPSTPPCRKVTA